MDPFALNGRSLDTDLLIFRSLFAIDSNTNLPVSSTYILGTDGMGGLNWQNIFTNISSYSGLIGAPIPYLPSTIYSFSSQLLTLSTITGTTFSTLSTTDAFTFSTLSTMIGRGGIPGSITSQELQSTVSDIYSTTKYISSGNLISTVDGFLTGPFAQSSFVISSVIGLGTIGYVSSLSLGSTVTRLYSYIDSNITNLGTDHGYLSSPQLLSTVRNLGIASYISSSQLRSTVSSIFLYTNTHVSATTNALGTYGYISTSQLLSTTQGTYTDLTRRINVDRAGNLNVYNSQVTVSSLQNLSFLSSFYFSTLTFTSNINVVNELANNPSGTLDITFPLVDINLNNHSNYIAPSTQITIDIYPFYTFSYINTAGAANATKIFQLSTCIRDNSLVYLSNPDGTYITTNSYFAGNFFATGVSNVFNSPIRFTCKGHNLGMTAVSSNIPNTTIVQHYIPNCLQDGLTPGFSTSNYSIYTPDRNWVFLSFVNFPYP
jgi:hypothetical protein